MLQAHVTNQFGWCLVGEVAHAVEERYATHAHGGGHLFQTDLAAAHVLHHILLDVLQQLLVHSIQHGVVRHARLLAFRCLLRLFLV